MKKIFAVICTFLFLAIFIACDDYQSSITSVTTVTSTSTTFHKLEQTTNHIDLTTTMTGSSTKQQIRTPIEDDGTGILSFGISFDEFEAIVIENGWILDYSSKDRARLYYSHPT